MRKEVFVVEFQSNNSDHSENGVFLRRLKLMFLCVWCHDQIFKTFIILCPRLGTWITAYHRNRQLYLTVAIFVLALQFRNNNEDCNTKYDMWTEMWNCGILKFACQLLFILKKLKFFTNYEAANSFMESKSLQIFDTVYIFVWILT